MLKTLIPVPLLMLALIAWPTHADTVRELSWDDLVPETADFDDPFEKLTEEQLYDLGFVVRTWERKAKDEEQAADRRERGVLLGSGFVGGEGLLGVGIALVAVAKSRRPDGIGTEWLGSEVTAMIVGAIAFALFATWFFRLVRGNNPQ